MPPASDHQATRSGRYKALIVSHDHAKIGVLVDALVGEDYETATVNSANEALEYYVTNEPDLVLLDVDLPGAAVFDLCRGLALRYSSMPASVILIASRRDPDVLLQGFAAGAVDYIAAPFSMGEVLARLRVHVLSRLRIVQMENELRAKNRQLCTAAHDLRNPLVSIRGLANILWAGNIGPLNALQQDVVNTVSVASQSMLDLLNELLDASVYEAGEVQINPESTSLEQLLETTVKLNNATAAQKGSTIVVQPGELPERITVDPPKIQQVLNNLFGNAIKFSPPGSIITVKKYFDSRHCAIAIRDRGPGIRDDERFMLFKDFSRTSVKPTGGESSTGLGLSICATIMRAHGGTITADNAPDGGAEFRITIPFNSCS